MVKLNRSSLKHNKAFKRDSCRVAFLVCGDFCGESGVRKLGLGGIHPLTGRYVLITKNQLVASFLCFLGFLILVLSAS
ncbi:DUF3265 domain-containing protein [Vibrio vulnificus]|nr:DUF3265 domain-containing protein [Vibrio vulnificus]EGQ9971734.1 DUF3265 domain-containing protein [Vibrio vulnificus]EIJ0944063.1 DUF3265 domain-containing protein [Vibrio vulnificus]